MSSRLVSLTVSIPADVCVALVILTSVFDYSLLATLCPTSAYESLQRTGCAPLLLGASVFGRAENRRLSAGIGNERQLQSSNRIEFLVQTKQTDSVPPLQAGDFAQFLQAFNAGLGQNAQSAGRAVDMRLLTTLSPSAIPSSAPTMQISVAPLSDPSTLPSHHQ